MSGPQLEDGYIRIANELYDAILQFPFTKRELLVLLAVIRKTYGFGKKSDDITLSQLSDMTGLDSADCSKTLKDLATIKVLAKRQGQYGQVIEIKKNHKQWKVLAKRQGLVKRQGGIGKTPKDLLVKHQPQKTTPKDNTQKEGAEAPDPALPAVTEETMWKIGVSLGIDRGAIGRAVKESSMEKVAEVIGGMLVNKPVDPKSYLMAAIHKHNEPDGFMAGAI